MRTEQQSNASGNEPQSSRMANCYCTLSNMRSLIASLFVRDRGMVVFLAFLVLVIIVLPMVTLSLIARLALSATFALTLILGAFATIRHRILIALVVILALGALSAGL